MWKIIDLISLLLGLFDLLLGLFDYYRKLQERRWEIGLRSLCLDFLKIDLAWMKTNTLGYLQFLERLLHLCRKSILLTCVVPPKWFREDPHREQKEAILKAYKKAKAGDRRRILILSEDTVRMQLLRVQKQQRKGKKDDIQWFLENSGETEGKFKNYWTTPELIQASIPDYGLFDEKVVIEFDFNKQILKLTTNPRLLEDRRKIFQITETTIDTILL